jgi:hypothetical protein
VTVDDLPRALNFYLKAGFSEMGRRPDIIWRTYHDLCFMEKEVTPKDLQFHPLQRRFGVAAGTLDPCFPRLTQE